MTAYDTDLRTDPDRLRALMAGASTVPFWLDGLDRVATSPLRQDLTADLVVVGGGYCGLWTALLAKRADPTRHVVLLEAAEVGWAASGRNGGFVESSLTHGETNGRRYFPDELDLLERLGRENLDAFEADLITHAIDAEFERVGVLSVAVEPHQVAEARQEAGGELLEGDSLARYTRSPLALAATFDGGETALVHPAKLAQGLLKACLELGVEVHERTPVRHLRNAGDRVEVEIDGGTVRARSVVLATNGFPSLLRRTRLLTVPIYDYVLMTEPLSAQQLEEIGWVGRHGMADRARQFHYYRKSADDRILWGGFDAVYHRGGRVRPEHDQREETFLRLADHFVRTFPQLGDVRFTHRWGGMIDMSSRLVAFHGTAMGGKVAYSSGFTGLGVGATRFAADVMLELLAGESTERTRTKLVRTTPLPIPPEPVRYPAVQVIRAAVTRSDRAGGRDGLLLRAANAVGYSFDS